MAQLVIDFTARALTTALARPIASASEVGHCGWQPEDFEIAPPQQERPAQREALPGLLKERAANYKHSRGRAFTEHLHGVSALLARWGAPAFIVDAGLCHSLYSTQQYPYGLYAHSDREQVQSILGLSLERLVFLFCSHDRVDLYGQVVELAKAGKCLPADGLTLRNALTREQAVVPRDVLSLLLMIHAADIVEQMNGFSFEFIYSVFYVIQPCVEPPSCFAEMKQGGLQPANIKIRINPSRGTVGLLPILGLNRELLGLRARILAALRHKDGLSRKATSSLSNLLDRYPYVLDLAWTLASRGEFDSGERSLELRDRSCALMQSWSVPWLKTPFERDAEFMRLQNSFDVAPAA